MDYKFVTGESDGTGIIYAIDAVGDLFFFKDKNRNGTADWQQGAARIGEGWHHFRHVFAGGDGILYAINEAGELLFYKDMARDGTRNWHPNSGRVIGSGWGTFLNVFYGGDSAKPGIIYAVFPDGNLRYYRDLSREGISNWENSGLPKYIGTGWQSPARMFADESGVIYAITTSGALLFYKDQTRDGTGSVGEPSAGLTIGSGWDVFYEIFAGGGGAIYGIKADGSLVFYRDQARNGTQNWANGGSGQTLRSDFVISGEFKGYCWPLSAQPGQQIAFKISSPEEYTVTYRRLDKVLVAPADGSMGTRKGESFEMPPGAQGSPDPTGVSAAQNGFGWSTSFTLTIPADWESGIYAAHLTKLNRSYYVVFIVKPASSTQAAWPTRIAALANTNTWNAYNGAGGCSKYSGGVGYKQSFQRPNDLTQPLRGTSSSTYSQSDHLTSAELWVLNWLENSNYHVDVYSDRDFHDLNDSEVTAFAQYGALLLSTHPEYWTRRMFSNLEKFLAAGGRLLYLAGNGVFEHVKYDTANPSIAIHFEGNQDNDSALFASTRKLALMRNLQKQDDNGVPLTSPSGAKVYMAERTLLGVAYRSDNAPWLASPDPGDPLRVVDADQRFFAGTELQNGDLFGQEGYNGPASGWEMDTSLKGIAADDFMVTLNEGHPADELKGADNLADDRGSPPQVASFKVLARGTNSSYGADMTYYETGHTQSGRPAGFVFAAGSLSLGGSLVVDSKLQRIVKNTLGLAGVTV